MTPERAKELLPVIKAFTEGKQVQMLFGDNWIDSSTPTWSELCTYRIKPEKKSPGQLLCQTWNPNSFWPVPANSPWQSNWEGKALAFLKAYNEQEAST